jgi:molybdopterin/thiamine biosynthesis adenylyltransferase/rhodanese-related sulfurtransferase
VTTAGLKTLDVAAAAQAQHEGALLVDVREPAEWASGSPPGALRVTRGDLLADPGRWLPADQRPVLLLCAAGRRAQDCGERLAAMGHRGLVVVEGGLAAWRAAGLPVEASADPEAAWQARYARQTVLPEVGAEGQRRLGQSRVLLVGAGGLGSPVALYLAAAGVGLLRIADDDVVDASNLQRQVLHGTPEVGQAKVRSALARLSALNPHIAIEAVPERVRAANIEALAGDVDLIIDGSDNLPTRYLLSDAALALGKPLIYGAVERFTGQVSVFHPAWSRGFAPCYRCLFPEPPAPEDAPNCADIGVLGVLPGLVGLWQASEALKWLLGIGEPLIGRLLLVDALAARTREVRIPADPDCAWCAPGRAFPGYADYAAFCAARPS